MEEKINQPQNTVTQPINSNSPQFETPTPVNSTHSNAQDQKPPPAILKTIFLHKLIPLIILTALVIGSISYFIYFKKASGLKEPSTIQNTQHQQTTESQLNAIVNIPISSPTKPGYVWRKPSENGAVELIFLTNKGAETTLAKPSPGFEIGFPLLHKNILSYYEIKEIEANKSYEYKRYLINLDDFTKTKIEDFSIPVLDQKSSIESFSQTSGEWLKPALHAINSFLYVKNENIYMVSPTDNFFSNFSSFIQSQFTNFDGNSNSLFLSKFDLKSKQKNEIELIPLYCLGFDTGKGCILPNIHIAPNDEYAVNSSLFPTPKHQISLIDLKSRKTSSVAVDLLNQFEYLNYTSTQILSVNEQKLIIYSSEDVYDEGRSHVISIPLSNPKLQTEVLRGKFHHFSVSPNQKWITYFPWGNLNSITDTVFIKSLEDDSVREVKLPNVEISYTNPLFVSENKIVVQFQPIGHITQLSERSCYKNPCTLDEKVEKNKQIFVIDTKTGEHQNISKQIADAVDSPHWFGDIVILDKHTSNTNNQLIFKVEYQIKENSKPDKPIYKVENKYFFFDILTNQTTTIPSLQPFTPSQEAFVGVVY